MNRGSEGEIGDPSSNSTRVYYITLSINKKKTLGKHESLYSSSYELNNDSQLSGKIIVILLMLYSLSKNKNYSHNVNCVDFKYLFLNNRKSVDMP